MFAQDVKKVELVNNDYESIFLSRRCVRALDSTYVVPQEEIEQIIKEAMVATPTAVDSNPYKLLVVNTPEGKQRLDDIMAPVDKSRVIQSSFAIVPLADRNWIDYYDDILAANEAGCKPWHEFFQSVGIKELASGWYEMLTANGTAMLDKSVNFQAGLISMSLMFAARAHGLDSGFMDAWLPEQDLDKAFPGIDKERYVAQGVIAFGKAAGPGHNCYRKDIADAVEFF